MITTFERDKLEPPARGSVVSIGVFDGVHRGHQAILARNVEVARELDAVSTVITFRRHPKRLLLGRSPKTLTTLDHRLELFARAGIEHAVALSFDERLRELSAEEFARSIAVEGLGVRRFVLGFDSRFGRDREGTPERLRELGYDVEIARKVVVDAHPVSSTAIREAVELGDLATAERMLGRPVSVLGRVVHGQNLGAKIGFPTANLDLHHSLHPPPGVYACRAQVFPDEPDGATLALAGVANLGFRPTVHPEGDEPTLPTLEVHLFDFEDDIYGRRMELSFVAFLRGEQRFGSVDELTAQIARDVERARALLGA